VAQAIHANLESAAEVTVWSQETARASSTILEDLLRILEQMDYGIFVFSPDDHAVVRGQTQPAVRDNVILELGLFLGRLGRDRAFALRPRRMELHIPSDLLGWTQVEYDGERSDGNWTAATATACRHLAQIIQREGPRTGKPLPRLDANLAQTWRSELPPADNILAERDVGTASFLVLIDDILNARTDVIVTSDDNHFTARGGVSKAVRQRGGDEMQRQLDAFKRHPFRQGHVVVTTGGSLPVRAVIHAAVIDLDETRYPTRESTKLVTNRVLNFAEGLGARSVALPVLGGGFASRNMAPTDNVEVIATAVVDYLERSEPNGLSRVVLYLFRETDAEGLPAELLMSQRAG
jgi:O-acetyl-ADP-ribose deacetylase (regulator of RNase III)